MDVRSHLRKIHSVVSVAMPYCSCWACICLFEYVCKSHGAMICKPPKPMSFFQLKDKMYLASRTSQQFFFTESQRFEIIFMKAFLLFVIYTVWGCKTGWDCKTRGDCKAGWDCKWYTKEYLFMLCYTWNFLKIRKYPPCFLKKRLFPKNLN